MRNPLPRPDPVTSADDYVLQLLLDHHIIDAEVFESARAHVQEQGYKGDFDTAVLDSLVKHQYVTYPQVTELLGKAFNMEVIDLNEVSPEPEVLELLSSEVAKRYHVFPIHLDGNELHLAICDPLDVDSLDSLGHLLGRSIMPSLATHAGIEGAIRHHYGSEGERAMEGIFADFNVEGIPGGAADGTGNKEEDEQAPIIRYVHLIITEAIKRRASDIHLEPLEKRFRIRYRIDGVLQEMESPPKRLQPSIISRLKLMSNVSLAEKRKPQDGRIQVKHKGKDMDLRVSVLPTAFGESIVARILDKEGLKLGLPELGFFSDDQEEFERLIGQPDGVFLVTGPTGSGKSTTLYSALNVLNQPDRKIITVEDPVEYMLAGINQVQVRKEVGMTFALALRSMLRQAPNIVMVGEIRDKETAEIAINASLTGHMVFSTLHTNDAPSAVTRLVDIGVKPYLVAAALRGALAQRLVRKIYPDCRVEFQPEEKDILALGLSPAQAANMKFYQAVGNAQCPKGYRGRCGVFEVFSMTDELQTMIFEGATLVELRNKARELGMRTMREDGIRKVASGITTLEELLKVTV